MAAAAVMAATSACAVVTDPTQVGEARRLASRACRTAGLDEAQAGRVAIVVTEAASNIVRHGAGGQVVLRVLAWGEARGVEMLALDKGRGIANVAAALRDGHSTGGTPGTGLGAMQRLSTVFDLYTSPGHGTAVLSQVWTGTPARPQHGAVCMAKTGETESGDVWAVQAVSGGCRVMVVDGLGHGTSAREAALAAVQAMLAARGGITDALTAGHLAARPTRGCAAAVAEVLVPAREVRYAGIGNIGAALLGGNGSRSLVSTNGTLGLGQARPREFTYPSDPGSLLVLYSDGLVSHWSLDAFPGLQARHPSLVAGVLYRDHTRGRDDVTVVAVRVEEGG